MKPKKSIFSQKWYSTGLHIIATSVLVIIATLLQRTPHPPDVPVAEKVEVVKFNRALSPQNLQEQLARIPPLLKKTMWIPIECSQFGGSRVRSELKFDTISPWFNSLFPLLNMVEENDPLNYHQICYTKTPDFYILGNSLSNSKKIVITGSKLDGIEDLTKQTTFIKTSVPYVNNRHSDLYYGCRNIYGVSSESLIVQCQSADGAYSLSSYISISLANGTAKEVGLCHSHEETTECYDESGHIYYQH